MPECCKGLVNSPQAAQLCHQLSLKLPPQIRKKLFWQAKITEYQFVYGSGNCRSGGIKGWNSILPIGKVV